MDVSEAPAPTCASPASRGETSSNTESLAHLEPEPSQEPLCPSPAVDTKIAGKKLQIHVDEAYMLPPTVMHEKPNEKLQIHVDEQEPRTTSPAQRTPVTLARAFSVLADEESGRQITPLAEKKSMKEALKVKTIPLKGFEDDVVLNDENTPPSQLEMEKAKATKKARREERSNRTRKIKVMEVKEIRNETQTSKY